MAVEAIAADTIAEVKRLANEHFEAPEVQYLFTTPLTPVRVGIWVAHQTRFVRNRRDCWALASGLAPLDVKRAIWKHEEDELIHDPRAGSDHYTLMLEQAQTFGLSAEQVMAVPVHPFAAAALDAWILLCRGSWLEAFACTATIEIINSNAIIQGGGFSSRMRDKLMAELGYERRQLRDQNVHVEADMEHTTIFDAVIPHHVTDECAARLVLATARRALDIDSAYRGGVAFAMRQVE